MGKYKYKLILKGEEFITILYTTINTIDNDYSKQ